MTRAFQLRAAAPNPVDQLESPGVDPALGVPGESCLRLFDALDDTGRGRQACRYGTAAA
ncbi:MAG: hypothetical protein ACREIR_17740 [Geminicoccaceae bacterium]